MKETRQTEVRNENSTIRTDETNYVDITGMAMGKFKFSHKVFGEGFYIIHVRIPRLSKAFDIIPVMVSDRLIDVTRDITDKQVQILGQYRSYNENNNGKIRLMLSVFAKEFLVLFDDEQPGPVKNQIYLNGYICKKPIYRKTPLGREIADIMLAVNRNNGKSDYIPCVVWGRNAGYVVGLNVGDNIQISGRVQSRKYNKQISEHISESRVAYEVSVNKIEQV